MNENWEKFRAKNEQLKLVIDIVVKYHISKTN